MGCGSLPASHYEQDLVCLLTGLRSSTLFTRLTARAPAYYTWHLQKNVLGSRTPGLEPRSGPLHCWFSIWLTEAQSHFETLSQYLARLKFAPLAQHILPTSSHRCGVPATSQAARPERLISNLGPGGPSASCDVCVFLS